MKNYKKINPGQSYDTIGREIGSQIKSNPTHDIKFVKAPNTEFMYETYVLESGNEVPKLNGFRFIGASELNGLAQLINPGLSKDNLPQEIRVISPWSGLGGLGVFFKE